MDFSTLSPYSSDEEIAAALASLTPEQKAELRKLIATQPVPTWNANRPQDWFHAGQLEAWACCKRIVAVISGTQGGKSTFGPWWLLREMQRKGPGDYCIVGPTLELLKKKALPEMERIFESELKLGKYKQADRLFVCSQQGLRKLFGRTDQPCKIYVGYATKSDSLEAATYKGVWADEVGQSDFKLASYRALRRRVSIHDGRFLFTTTPYSWNWLKTEIYDPWRNNEKKEEVEVINFASDMNPAFPRSEFEQMERELDEWYFDLMYRGKFTRPGGAVFQSFFEYGKCKRFEIPSSWRRLSGHDFGPIHTAGVFGAQDPRSGVIYIYGSYLPGKELTVEEHVRGMLHRQMMRAAPLAWGGAPSEDKWRNDFRNAGYSIRRPPVADIFEGIFRLNSLIRRGLFKVFDDLKHLVDEFQGYSYVVDKKTGLIRDDQIEDQHSYHRLDCCRYLACALYEGLAEAVPETAESRFEQSDTMPRPGRRPSLEERLRAGME
jgi:hypothetical protein